MDKTPLADGLNRLTHNQVGLQSIPIDTDKVIAAENLMKKFPQVELRVEHHFSYGVYARTLYIPKGVALTGHIHKYENLNILVKGKMSVLVDGQMRLIEAPLTIVSPPGTKRIAWALEDCIWTTIHGTHEKDLDIIDKYFIAKSKEEYLEFIGANQLQLEGITND